MVCIEGKDYRMEQVGKTPFYNLYFLEYVHKDKPNERSELKLFGYSVPFNSCIDYIVNKRLNDSDLTLNINEFIKFYEKTLREVITENTNISIIPKKTKAKTGSGEEEEEDND